MDWMHVALLLAAGGTAGFVAGLLGVGGGIIFTPVLLVYYQALGIPAGLLPALTIGSSLLCTVAAALASGRAHRRRGAVDGRVAVTAGLSSATAVVLMVRFVTTQPWYDAAAFSLLFALALLYVAARMVFGGTTSPDELALPAQHRSFWHLAGIGSAAGAVSSAVGVGGGIVLVPAYRRLLHLPMRRAVGTSSATIVLVAGAGVLTYAAMGWDAPGRPAGALGYVDVRTAALLALPAVASSSWGAALAHRIDTRWLRWTFAALAAIVAARLLAGALGGFA